MTDGDDSLRRLVPALKIDASHKEFVDFLTKFEAYLASHSVGTIDLDEVSLDPFPLRQHLRPQVKVMVTMDAIVVRYQLPSANNTNKIWPLGSSLLAPISVPVPICSSLSTLVLPFNSLMSILSSSNSRKNAISTRV